MPKKSKFVRVKCPDCEHEQVIFDHPSTVVKCIVCGRTIAKPSGGKGEILVEVVKEYT
ncbi:MAG: 30S ribosomal protein S27e [Archaeoglobaceae archaeon]|nr:30S ribosomal protein S27e [Archaeoglobaceae archaeon]MDW8118906.1 30S ribosomal protein S27e [Archaeoglobaceae archaeon]